MYMVVMAIDFASFYDVSVRFWNCSDICGIFCFSFYAKVKIFVKNVLITLINDGNTDQNAMFGTLSLPSAFLSTVWNTMPPTRYTNIKTITLEEKKHNSGHTLS